MFVCNRATDWELHEIGKHRFPQLSTQDIIYIIIEDDVSPGICLLRIDLIPTFTHLHHIDELLTSWLECLGYFIGHLWVALLLDEAPVSSLLSGVPPLVKIPWMRVVRIACIFHFDFSAFSAFCVMGMNQVERSRSFEGLLFSFPPSRTMRWECCSPSSWVISSCVSWLVTTSSVPISLSSCQSSLSFLLKIKTR